MEDVTVRAIDPRVEQQVAQAVKEQFRLDACPHCGGPRVYSKLKPLARCLACGETTPLPSVQPPKQRRWCKACRTHFYSVTAFLTCPKCREKKARREAIEAKWAGTPENGGETA